MKTRTLKPILSRDVINTSGRFKLDKLLFKKELVQQHFVRVHRFRWNEKAGLSAGCDNIFFSFALQSSRLLAPLPLVLF
jgi:hypothetical protein